MKNKFFMVALVAAILVGGMILISCANPNCPGDGKCEYNSHSLPSSSWCSNRLGIVDSCFSTSAKDGDKCNC